ncbi:SMI1/KNR4 family protein [Moraxella oblonga]|uniref:SMI1/KNR4 family protein n=1 Tax=Moraxella oblonga TaxID=200413 RepID=UPI00082AD191|nr:SMI1/KNR4 family protein [Moraxella oblonga]
MKPALPTKHQLIQALLSYANNIVPVDKQEILDFFISNNLPYHDEYIDFLAQFGGARTEFFDAINLNCTFQEIKEIYIEDHPDNAIPPNFSYFGTNDFSGIFCISKETGEIYEQKLNDKYEPVLGEIYCYDVWSLVFASLLKTYKNFINKNQPIISEISENQKIDFRYINKKLLLNDIQNPTMEYYFDYNNSILYSLNVERSYLITHILCDTFLKKVYE